jgi:hypothetical protein
LQAHQLAQIQGTRIRTGTIRLCDLNIICQEMGAKKFAVLENTYNLSQTSRPKNTTRFEEAALILFMINQSLSPQDELPEN